jgi:hypothetical protein
LQYTDREIFSNFLNILQALHIGNRTTEIIFSPVTGVIPQKNYVNSKQQEKQSLCVRVTCIIFFQEIEIFLLKSFEKQKVATQRQR